MSAAGKNNGNPALRKICSGYIGPIVCVIGLVGNILSVLVWKRINRKRSGSGKSAGVYLITLALVDSGLLICFVVTETLQQLVPEIEHNYHYALFYSYFGFPMFFFFIVASIWMIIGVTYNRFIAVVFPHRAQQLNSLTVTYALIICTLGFSFAINIPHFFNYHFKNGVGIAKTVYANSKKADLYDFWAHCMLLVLIPWFTILGLNSTIIYKLVKMRKFSGARKGDSKKERQTTVILLTITFSFLIFLLWQCLTQCFWMLHYGQNKKNTWFDVDSAYGPARLGVVINSSVNFLLYCLSGTIFRRELWNIFGRSYVKFENSSYMSTSQCTEDRHSSNTSTNCSETFVGDNLGKDTDTS